MRILIGLNEVGGFYRGLQTGFEQLHVQSDFIDLSANRFDYRSSPQSQSIFIRFLRFCKGRRLLKHALSLVLFFWALIRYDVFILGYNSTFFFYWDLAILRFFKKRIIYVFHGSDSRPPYIDGYVWRNVEGRALIKASRKMKNKIKRIERYADLILINPLHAHFFEKPVIPLLKIGFPIDIPERSLRVKNETFRILHAPSFPLGKGTREIKDAMERLKQKGYRFQFEILTGVTHDRVLQALSEADLVIDQIYFEGPVGIFASEAAFFGKPAVIGMYTDDYAGIYPPESLPKFYRCENQSVLETVEGLIKNKAFGNAADNFVKKEWSVSKVAGRILELIQNKIDPSLWYDPSRLTYFYGMGFSETDLKRRLRNFIEEGGEEALCLSDKPGLRKRFIEFAFS